MKNGVWQISRNDADLSVAAAFYGFIEPGLR